MKKVLLIMVLINWVANIACINFSIHRAKTPLNVVDTFHMEFDEYKCLDSNVIHIVDSMQSDSKRYFGNQARIIFYSYFSQQKGQHFFKLLSTTCDRVVDTSCFESIVNQNSGIVKLGKINLILNAYVYPDNIIPDSSLHYFQRYFRKTSRKINVQFLKQKNGRDCIGKKISLIKTYITLKDSIKFFDIGSINQVDYSH